MVNVSRAEQFTGKKNRLVLKMFLKSSRFVLRAA